MGTINNLYIVRITNVANENKNWCIYKANYIKYKLRFIISNNL